MVVARNAALSLFLALLVLPGAARGTDESGASDWSEARSEHFTLFGDLPPDALAAAAEDLERMREVLGQILPEHIFDAPVRNLVYLFGSEVTFHPYRASGSTGADGGYVIPGPEATYAASSGKHPTRQVYRQYVLELLHRELPGIPLWLRQGLAEYYATFEADETETRIGLPLDSQLHALRLLREYRLPLPELLALDAPPADHDPFTASAFYAQSWLVVHHLMSGDDAHRRRIVDYILRTRAGEDPVEAFRASFGVEDLDEHARELARYAAGRTFTYLRVPVATRGSHAVTVRALSEADAAFRQGDLLAQLGPSHRATAEAKLRRAVELDPGQAGAWAALGKLAEEAGEEKAALRHYEKAAALAPDDFRVLLRFGRATLQSLGGRRASDEASTAALAAATGALRRVTASRPGSGEAWAALGLAGVLAAEPDPAAPAALEKAVELLPADRTDVLFNLLLARARVGDAAGVDRAALALREAGAEPELLARAREIQLQLSLQEAHRLATAGRLDDAVALLAVVRAESGNPAVAEQADTLLQRLARAAEHNRFADGYSEAVELFHAGDYAAATAAVEEMNATARPGRQTEALEELRVRIELADGAEERR